MTTPQCELQKLRQDVRFLCNLFRREDGDCDIFTSINTIDTKMQEISNRMDMLQDQMSLIIKLLSKPNVG